MVRARLRYKQLVTTVVTSLKVTVVATYPCISAGVPVVAETDSIHYLLSSDDDLDLSIVKTMWIGRGLGRLDGSKAATTIMANQHLINLPPPTYPLRNQIFDTAL